MFVVTGLALTAIGGEAWQRLTVPFHRVHFPTVFVPGVGFMLPPDSEIRWTNHLDFWTVSRTNRLGFLDREPPRLERAAESCHIAMIGDSLVEARQVGIPEKFHVRLEEMAARKLPHLDVTTSAFGLSMTGQISQLALYDAYARHLRSRLVVLVFSPSDYKDNFPLWHSFGSDLAPQRQPYYSAARTEDGGFRRLPPDPDLSSPTTAAASGPPSTPQWRESVKRALDASFLWSWLSAKRALLFPKPDIDRMPLLGTRLGGGNSPFLQEVLAFTSFGLDQFKERAERDGAELVILTPHHTHPFDPIHILAAERGIPIIDQSQYIHSQGGELRDARWAHNTHWNPTGHRWAAEALLEHLKRNQQVCGEAAVNSP